MISQQTMIYVLNAEKRGEMETKDRITNQMLRDLKDDRPLGSDASKLTDAQFEQLKTGNIDFDAENEEGNWLLYDAYMNIVELLKTYCDLKEDYYPLIALWIIGTYFHKHFYSFPYLFLNAMRGSGKTRTLKLITSLSYKGEVQASLTEAVLFRTNGTLGLDEFESIGRNGNENLRELLNASYKKGTKVKRMRQKNTGEGMRQVVEEFDVYRPIVMANIWGMEEVLGDRCISLVLERSNNKSITQLVELYEIDEKFVKTKEILKKCSLCGVVAPLEVYLGWNNYINTKYNNYTSAYTTTYTKYTNIYNKLDNINIDGRNLEITMPLVLLASYINEEVLDNTLNIISKYIKEKTEDQFTESKDISLIDFVSQENPENSWERVNEITQKFREFTQENDDWVNSRWMGRALRRLNLIKEKRRLAGGVQVILDIEKAQEKISQFK